MSHSELHGQVMALISSSPELCEIKLQESLTSACNTSAAFSISVRPTAN